MAACQNLEWNLHRIYAHLLPTNPQELTRLVERCWRECLLTNSVLLLDCDEVNLAEGMRFASISQFIEGVETPLIVSTEERMPLRHRSQISLNVHKLTHQEQRVIWQYSLDSLADKLDDFIDDLVVQFNLSTMAIMTASWQIKNYAISLITDNIDDEDDNISLKQITESENISAVEEKEVTPKQGTRRTKKTAPSDNSTTTPSPTIPTIQKPQSELQSKLWNICRDMARPRLDDLAQRIETNATWDDLILPDKEKKVLVEIFDQVHQRVKVYHQWKLAGKSQRGLGISALFCGSSGTGKTMASEILAGASGLDLYKIDSSAISSKYIGETQKNLRRVFDAAEAGGAILLFDEADALFGKRTEAKDAHDRYANGEVNYLLQKMEEYQGLVILTTNMKDALDRAFSRRIRFTLHFSFPEPKLRVEMWRRVFPPETPTDGLDFYKLGKLNVAGGSIRNIAMNGAFLAASAGEPVMMKHLLPEFGVRSSPFRAATPTVLGVESEAIHPEKVKFLRQEIDITIRILVTITKKVTGKHRWRSLREAHTPNSELRTQVCYMRLRVSV